jgi:hypothetical protein
MASVVAYAGPSHADHEPSAGGPSNGVAEAGFSDASEAYKSK